MFLYSQRQRNCIAVAASEKSTPLVEVATSEGCHLEVLQWLRSEVCPWDVQVCRDSAASPCVTGQTRGLSLNNVVM